MPVFIAAIGGMLLNVAGSLVGRVLIAAGISVITYTGISITLDQLKANALASLVGLPPEVLGLLGILKVGQCINIITSATVAKLTMNGLTGDTMKKWVGK